MGEAWPEHLEENKVESLNYWTRQSNLIHTGSFCLLHAELLVYWGGVTKRT